MLHSPSSALRHIATNTAIFILGDTAVVMCVVVGDGGVTTDAGGLVVCTNVPALVVTTRILIGTVHVVVADDLTLHIGGVGGTVLGALVITCL